MKGGERARRRPEGRSVQEDKQDKQEKEENTETSLNSLSSLGSLYVRHRERHPCGVCAALSQKKMTAYMVTLFTQNEWSRGRRQAPPNKKAEVCNKTNKTNKRRKRRKRKKRKKRTEDSPQNSESQDSAYFAQLLFAFSKTLSK